MPKGHKIKYTSEQLEFIRTNCHMNRKELTNLVNFKFNATFTVTNIEILCTRKKWLCGRTGRFENGNLPYNKNTKGISKANRTSFKKGHLTWITKPYGFERIDKRTGYIFVKSEITNSFVSKQRLIWAQHNGPIPDGCVIAFKNMDKTDHSLNNLMLMTKAEMVRYNQNFYNLANSETNETCLLMAKVKTKSHQVIKGGASC